MQHNPADLPFMLPSTGEILEPGIYYDISMDDYVGIKALSRSGIKDLLISPLTFWINSPFNPAKVREEKDAQVLGEAHHTRFLEGREAFLAKYAPEFDPSEYPDAIGGGEKLRARCKELGVSAGGTLAEMSKRIREKEHVLCDTEDERDEHGDKWEMTSLLYFLELEHLEKHKGKVLLPAAKINQLEIAAQAVESSAELLPFLRGGRSEVTLLWRDKVYGVPMKARCDYLSLGETRTWLEFKTFTNLNGLEISRAVASAMAGRKYGLQAITNLTGLEELGEPVDRAIFLFQETGNVPNVVPRLFNRTSSEPGENLYWSRAMMDFQFGIARFAQFYADFGEAPWNPPAELLPFEDADFPAWSR